MDDNSNKPAKRRNKFAGKEDVTRETVDKITAGQIEQLREIASTIDSTTSKIHESVDILYKKRISVDTDKFEQLNHYFIAEMENKLHKIKQPSNGLRWNIVMWFLTLTSAFLAGYFIHERQEWKEKAEYWHQQYEEVVLEK